MSLVTIIVEKWQIYPQPGWFFQKERQVEAKITAKRVKINDGLYDKVFDRSTGRQIGKGLSNLQHKYSLKLPIEV